MTFIGTKGPSSGDLMSMSDDLGVVTSVASTTASAFTRVSHQSIGMPTEKQPQISWQN